MTCQSRAGLLVMRICGEPMVAACTICSRPVCQRHLAMGPAGAACAECAAKNPGFAETEETRLEETRAQYFGAPGTGRAPQYGQGNYFSRTDAAALGQGAAGRRREDDDAYSS